MTQDRPLLSARPWRRDLWWGVAVVVWALSVTAGMASLWCYKLTASPEDPAPATWPGSSELERSTTLPTIAMFVHPKCACSRASLGELARLMTDLHGRAAATVAFLRPEGVEDEWEKTDLWQRASEIPGVSVRLDRGGGEARRFGAVASGTTLLYGVDGRLLFHGGITSARGHEGESAGRRRITSLVGTGRSDRADSPVYGCELESAQEREGRDDHDRSQAGL